MATIIPFVRDKKKREEIKKDFDGRHQYIAESNIRKHLDSINKKMAELKEMAALSESGVALPPPPVPPVLPDVVEVAPTTTLDEKELDKEYRRKKDEMEKKRKENNKKVTSSYNLLGPRNRDR